MRVNLEDGRSETWSLARPPRGGVRGTSSARTSKRNLTFEVDHLGADSGLRVDRGSFQEGDE